MSKNKAAVNPLPAPKPVGSITVQTVMSGPLVSPHMRLRMMSAAEWEEFVVEWASSLKSKYSDVKRCGGAGDMGRDIIAWLHKGKGQAAWHNFQCKHYDHALYPSDIWLEVGKACYYTFAGEYPLPEEYYFVAPQGLGTSATKLLENPDELRVGLVKNWAKECENGITSTKSIPLVGDLKKYVEGFDFSIFKELMPARLIAEHRATPWFAARFGGGLPPRPPAPMPPSNIQSIESRYVRQLFEAYSDCLGCSVGTVDELKPHSAHQSHLNRSRVHFYSAESLRTFSRDNLPPQQFDDLQDEILDAVLDTATLEHPNGFERVLATVAAARGVQLTSNALTTCLKTQDRAGICHQLANDDKLTWVPK